MGNLIQQQRRKFFVYIIESPSGIDIYHRRSEGEILSQALSLAGIPFAHKTAVNLEAFIASLTIGLGEYLKEQTGDLLPAIHISAHGNEKGIQLTSKEIVGWDRLRNLIMPINKILNGKLLLCISSCGGFSACRMAMSEGELPFVAVVGHFGKPTWSDTAIAYVTLYHLLGKKYSVKQAVEAMRVASGNTDFHEVAGREAKQAFIEEFEQLERETLMRELLKNIPDEVSGSPLAKALRETNT